MHFGSAANLTSAAVWDEATETPSAALDASDAHGDEPTHASESDLLAEVPHDRCQHSSFTCPRVHDVPADSRASRAASTREDSGL
jgi:hypothetical protein